MMLKKLFQIFTFLFISQLVPLQGEQPPKNCAIFLSSLRSGTNLVTCSLLAITRKPIGTYLSGEIIQVATHRLDLPLASQIPFLYRSHDAQAVSNVATPKNKLILLTRNPKELLFRKFKINHIKELKSDKVMNFLNTYLDRFRVYESWDSQKRYLLFYEDFINDDENILVLEILQVIEEEPAFYEDYVENKELYHSKILDSYKKQCSGAGKSSVQGPTEIYYTENQDPKILKAIDQILSREAPEIWEKYLKRFRWVGP